MTNLIPLATRFPHLSEDFEKQIDCLVGQFFGGSKCAEISEWFSPNMNVEESEKDFRVSLDLPGIKPDEVTVEFKQGVLWISGERASESEEKDKKFHRVESHFGKFRRMVRFREEVDTEHVGAEYKDGVLNITIPKAETARTKRVEIKT